MSREIYNLYGDELRTLIDDYCVDGNYKQDIDYKEGFYIPVERCDRERRRDSNDEITIAYDGDDALVADRDLVDSLLYNPEDI